MDTQIKLKFKFDKFFNIKVIKEKKRGSLVIFWNNFTTQIEEIKSTISFMSLKEPIVSFSFKDGECPTLDSSFETIHEAYRKITFEECMRTSYPPCLANNGFAANLIDRKKDLLKLFFESEKQQIVEKCMSRYHRIEMQTIRKNLEGKCFYNLTNIDLETGLAEKWINLGKNYNPHILKTPKENYNSFLNSTKLIVQKLLLRAENINIVFDDSDFKTQLEKILYTKPLSIDIQKFIDKMSTHFNSAHSDFMKCSKNTNPFPDLVSQTDLENTYNIPGYLFLEADKNVGYVLLSNEDILEQYRLINIKQKFTKVDTVEEDYLLSISKTINSCISEMPNELKILIPYKLLLHTKPDSNHSIGIMRLLPKA